MAEHPHTAAGYADTAAELLTTQSYDPGLNQVHALQGIGWALLALRAGLADQLADLTLADQLADLTDAVSDVEVQISEVAAAIDAAAVRPGRVRGALARLTAGTGRRPCPGCVGRGTGARCCACGGTIPETLRLAPGAPSEVDPGCGDCVAGRVHAHKRDAL